MIHDKVVDDDDKVKDWVDGEQNQGWHQKVPQFLLDSNKGQSENDDIDDEDDDVDDGWHWSKSMTVAARAGAGT